MMPRPRASGLPDAPVRHGGVLLLLYPHHGRLHLVLTQRTETLPNHRGQISLPGGAQESGESFTQTALRETEEELGIDPTQIWVVGDLTPLYISASNYCIHPIVGYMSVQPTFQPDPSEVAQVLQVPVSSLLDPATAQEETWFLRGTSVRVPLFNLDGHKVWGATAMVLAEFVELIAMTP